MKFFKDWQKAEIYAKKHGVLFSISNDYKGLAGTHKELDNFAISEKGIAWFHGYERRLK